MSISRSKARQRFLREAKAAAKIVHPNVATVFQFGEEGDAYFYNASRFRRVLRGASWLNEHPDDLLLSNRRDDSLSSRRDNYGFRCVLS